MNTPGVERSASGGRAAAESSARSGGARTILRFPASDLMILLAIGAVYVGVMSYLGLLRFEDFYTANWDLGINQQLLWTGAHGHLLYESGDAEFYNTQSFLQVHSTFVAFAVVPIYALAPVPYTLFVLQSSVFVASLFPLFLLARRAIASRALIYSVIILYLASFAVLSGLLYDFHWEAFLPLEFLSFYYLVITRRYGWSLVPLIAGVCTLEVFPFLVGGVAVLLLVEDFQGSGYHLRAAARLFRVRFSIVLLVAMGLTYVALREIQYVLIPRLIGISGSASMASHAVGAPFSFAASSSTLGHSAIYWLLLLATLAFLPLLAPKYLILVLPWFVVSVFLTPLFSAGFGDQYALVATALLSVSAIHGMARLERIQFRGPFGLLRLGALVVSAAIMLSIASVYSTELLSTRAGILPLELLTLPPLAILALFCLPDRDRSPATVPTQPKSGPWTLKHARTSGVAAALVCFVAFNFLMSPLNTTNFEATPFPGYQFEFNQNPASSDMSWLTGFIPVNGVVLASDFLFPYVANDANAWAVPWYPFAPGQPPVYFPFNATVLPAFVLLDNHEWSNLPQSIESQVLNTSIYGLVGYIYVTQYPGTIYLFERGYTGSPMARFVSTPASVVYFAPTDLSLGASGLELPAVESRFGTVISSTPVSDPTYVRSCIWFGPYTTLLPGTYNVTVNLTGELLPGGNPLLPIITMNGGPWFLPSLYNFTFYRSQFSTTGWTDLTWTLRLPLPYPLMEFRGYLTYRDGSPNGEVDLNYIEVSR
jgi:uncharacterized membrane protein